MKTETMLSGGILDAEKNVGGKKVVRLINTLFQRKNIVTLILAFLLGRSRIAEDLMPFGIAFYASTFGLDVSRIPVAIFVIIGMLSVRAGGQIYMAFAAMLLFNAFNIPFSNRKPKQNFRLGVTAFISAFLPGMVAAGLQGFLLYDILKTLFFCFVIFLLVFIFNNAIPAVVNWQKQNLIDSEEIISISITAALALSGLGEMQLFGFGIRNILRIIVILISGYLHGAGVGAAAGVTIGLLTSITSDATPLLIGSFAFCGLLSGVFKNLGRIGASLGFVMGNAVLTLYLNGSTEVLLYLKEIITAIVLFLLIPHRLLDSFALITDKNTKIADKKSYSLRIKEITVEKLNKFSRTFEELSRTFSEISQTNAVADKQDISSMFDRVADKVCKDCSLCLYCWDRNFYSTYQVLFRIIERLDTKGRIEESDVPDYFMERCERINDFIKAVNNTYEIFKVDMVWKCRVGESRNLVSQQLEGLSKVILGLADEINANVHFKKELENRMMAKLNEAGIKAEEVIVYENKWGKYEANILHKGCGGVRTCVSTIEKIVSGVAGRKMNKDNTDCHQRGKTGKCVLKLVEEETYSVITGIARAAKCNGMVSGDSYSFMNSGNGKFIAALSDGMGSGQKAAIQSRTTINLLEQFMESGFDKDTAVKLINSILILKSSDDSFSTIDLSVIDLYSGEVEFVKTGAMPTFIKRVERVETIRTASLPAGILSNIEMELVHKNVESGDFIIMMTDGVMDAFNKGTESDRSMVEFLTEISSINPQKIADSILEKAYIACGENPEDDMTVLVSKVWKRTG